MPTDVTLNNDHDLDLTNGQFNLFDDNPDVVAQRIKIAILTRRNEWFRDISTGVPYYSEFFQAKNNKNYIDQFMKSYIIEIEDVSRLVTYESYISTNRQLVISFTVQTYSGEIVDVSLEV